MNIKMKEHRVYSDLARISNCVGLNSFWYPFAIRLGNEFQSINWLQLACSVISLTFSCIFINKHDAQFASLWWNIDEIAFRTKNNVNYFLLIMIPTLSPYLFLVLFSFRSHCYLLAVIVSLKLFVTHKQSQITKIEVFRSANNQKSLIANFNLRINEHQMRGMRWNEFSEVGKRKKPKRTVSERRNNMPAMGVEGHVFFSF